MESRFGTDFSDVRLHDGAAAAASAAGVGARAYTSGSHVVLGEDGADKHTLAHELTHILQQRTGPVQGTDYGGGLRVSDPSDAYERAAEANAGRVMSDTAAAGRVPVLPAAARPPAAGPVPGVPVIQRGITFKGKRYGSYPKDEEKDDEKGGEKGEFYPLLKAAIDAAKKEEEAAIEALGLTPEQRREGEDRIGKALSTSAVVVVAGTYVELIQRLRDNLGAGKEVQERGAERENAAAAHVPGGGGSVPRRGLDKGGLGEPEWCKGPWLKLRSAKADPDVFNKVGNAQKGTVSTKPDVWSENGLGIVGGPAKAEDMPIFKERCASLKAVCDSHGKQAWVFFSRGGYKPGALRHLRAMAIEARINEEHIMYTDGAKITEDNIDNNNNAANNNNAENVNNAKLGPVNSGSGVPGRCGGGRARRFAAAPAWRSHVSCREARRGPPAAGDAGCRLSCPRLDLVRDRKPAVRTPRPAASSGPPSRLKPAAPGPGRRSTNPPGGCPLLRLMSAAQVPGGDLLPLDRG